VKKKPSLGWRDVGGVGESGSDAVVVVSCPGPDDSRSVMRVSFDPDDDYRIRSVSLTMPGRITASELRRFPWGRWISAADTFFRDPELRAWRAAVDAQQQGLAKKPASAAKDSKPVVASGRPGRRGHPDEHYRAVAKRYRELVSTGIRNPTATIAAEQIVSHNTVAGWLRVARERKYLPPSRPGKPG
jgi:hypothetical protein